MFSRAVLRVHVFKILSILPRPHNNSVCFGGRGGRSAIRAISKCVHFVSVFTAMQ